MTPDEIVDLLSLVAARDRRTVGMTDVAAWHEDIGDLRFDDARAAVVLHFRRSSTWLMPSDIRRLVKTIREERISVAPIPAPPADDPVEYIRQLRGRTRALGDGTMRPAAIAGGAGLQPSGNPCVRRIRGMFAAERNALRQRKATERQAAIDAIRAYVDAQSVLLALPDLGQSVLAEAFEELFGVGQAAVGFPLATKASGTTDQQKTVIRAARLAQRTVTAS